jgi:hypothetical protein
VLIVIIIITILKSRLEVVTHPTCIRDMLGLSLGWNAACPDRFSLISTESLQENAATVVVVIVVVEVVVTSFQGTRKAITNIWKHQRTVFQLQRIRDPIGLTTPVLFTEPIQQCTNYCRLYS